VRVSTEKGTGAGQGALSARVEWALEQ